MRKLKLIILVIVLFLILITLVISIFYQSNITGLVVSSNEPIKIGAILPLSGKAASYGQSAQEAIELALENNKNFEIVYEDSQGQPTLGVNAVNKLINFDKVSIILGPIMSSVTLAVAPIAEENKIILITISSNPQITEAGDYIFRNREKASQQSEKIAEFIFKELNIKEIATLYSNDDTGKGHYSTLIKNFEKLGGKILISETYEPTINDFRTQLTKIKNVNPKVIYLAGKPKDVGMILKQARELGINSQFIGTSGSEGKVVIEIAGSAAEGLIYSLPSGDITKKDVADFYKEYKEKCDVCYIELGALFYDSVKIIEKVIEKCGENTDCIKQELYKVKDYYGASGKTSFDEYGDATKTVILKTVKDGKFIPYKE